MYRCIFYLCNFTSSYQIEHKQLTIWNVFYAPGIRCAKENREFLECKGADEDPEACLEKGQAVQSCVVSLLKNIVHSCGTEFSTYSKCLDGQISEEYMFDRCRKEQKAMEQCRGTNSEASKRKAVTASPAESKRST